MKWRCYYFEKMAYEGNMTGWLKALEDCSIDLEFGKKTKSKLAQLKVLIRSGLPTYDFYFFNLNDLFNPKGFDKKLVEVYNIYNQNIVARLVSKDGSVRITSIGRSLEENLTFFKRKLKLKDYNEEVSSYVLIINEYDPAQYCGVIISDKERLVIEMVEDDNLEKLCHGHVIPWSAEFKEELPFQFKKMVYYNVEDIKIRNLMWQVVKSISEEKLRIGNNQRYEPKFGYFEFVISKKNGGLKFVDYNPDF